MEITVESYNEISDYHVCIDEHGRKRNFDLLTDGAFHEQTKDFKNAEQTIEFCRSLVGRKFHVDHHHPWVEFACGLEEISS